MLLTIAHLYWHFCVDLPRYALFGVLLVLIHQSLFSSTSQSSRQFDWILIKFYLVHQPNSHLHVLVIALEIIKKRVKI